MRIASISKPITMAIVAKLWEDNKLDLDEPVTKYVKDWPETVFNNKKVRTYNVSVVRFYFVFNQHSNHPSLRRRLKPSNTRPVLLFTQFASKPYGLLIDWTICSRNGVLCL